MKSVKLFFFWTALVLVPFASFAHDDCSEGIVYDDGGFEFAYLGGEERSHFAMLMEQPEPLALVDFVCLCFIRNSDSPTDLTFDLSVWDDDGVDGSPGTLLGKVEGLQATDVRSTLNPTNFFTYEFAGSDLPVEGNFYLGPSWDAEEFPGFRICADESVSTPLQPAFFDASASAGQQPPQERVETGLDFTPYRALGIRAESTALNGIRLEDVAELIVPGYEVDTEDPGGPDTFLGLRNASTSFAATVELEYHGNTVTETPLRTDELFLNPDVTFSTNVRSDLTDLDPDLDGVIEGLLFVAKDDALDVEGDYFRVDFSNNFASGDRMVRPSEFCNRQEIRFIDFGSGTQLQILLNLPRDAGQISFSYEALSQQGDVVVSGNFFTDRHLNVIDVTELGPTGNFGTVIFDFTESLGGWVSARYSAFGLFSAELNATCRD